MLRSDLINCPESTIVATQDRLIVAVKITNLHWSVNGRSNIYSSSGLLDIADAMRLESIEIPATNDRRNSIERGESTRVRTN